MNQVDNSKHKEWVVSGKKKKEIVVKDKALCSDNNMRKECEEGNESKKMAMNKNNVTKIKWERGKETKKKIVQWQKEKRMERIREKNHIIFANIGVSTWYID